MIPDPYSSDPYSYLRLMRFDKPIGTLLLLWPTLWALWVAGLGRPNWTIVAIFVLGVIVMRAAGCVINDFADRHIDGRVARTKLRPLATGEVSAAGALCLFLALALLALGLVSFLNGLTVKLALVAIALTIVYPFSKRVTHLPQFILGAAFAMSVPMAFAAQSAYVPAVAWVMFAAVVVWTVSYDTLYAMVDRHDDLAIGVKSTAILFGRFDRLIVGLLQLTTVLLLLVIGIQLGLAMGFYCVLAAASGLFVYQQRLVLNAKPALCFQAFLNNNWFGLLVFVAFLLG